LITATTPGGLAWGDNQKTIKLNTPGLHNVYNALAAISVARKLGVSIETCASALSNFSGIARRFETLGRMGGADIVIDYAHHPRELDFAFSTAVKLYKKPLFVFQPHTYTRTVALFDEFVDSLKNQNVVIYKTYSAREISLPGGTGLDLAVATGKLYFHNSDCLMEYIGSVSKNHDAIIFLGAGDIDQIARVCVT